MAVVGVSLLTACGASAPPAKELADEMVETLDVSQSVKDCMHEAIANFSLTEEQAQGFKDFDEVATKAAGNNELAIGILAQFEAALASCN
ncbi:MAG TPA: hypothetical protein VLA10_01445 [Ilumatobacter sp.]|nr:hypothetical protein [Ilumatobacter sp.]